MITYDDLRRCAKLAQEADRLREHIVQLLAQVYGTGARNDGVPGARVADPVGSIAVKLSQLRDQWQAVIDENVELLQKAEAAIGQIERAEVRMILRMRYYQGDSWSSIAEKAHYSVSQCRLLHDLGLQLLGLKTKK